MSLKNKIVEIAYSLKDKFTSQVTKITGSMRTVERQADKSADKIERSNKRISQSFVKAGKVMAGFFTGTAIVGATAKFKQYVDEIDRLSKTARKLGTTTEELSKLGYAAELTGVKTNTLNMGLQRMTRRIAEAAQGSGAAKDALEELGLSAKDLSKLSVDEQFKAIADAFENVTNQTDKVRLGFKIFDSEGVALINTMEGGRAALEAYGDELDRIGGVIGTDAAKSAEDLNDAVSRFNANINAFTNRYGPAFIQTLNRSMEGWGLGAKTALQSVTAEITELYEKRDELTADKNLWDVFFGPSQVEKMAELEQVEAKLGDLIFKRTKLLNPKDFKKNSAEIISTERESAGQSEQIQKRQTTDLKNQLKEREQAYSNYLASLKSVQQQQKDINKEFSDLAEDMRSDNESIDEPDLGDIQDLRAASRQQLAAGEFDEAIASARQAGELLRKMKEEGSESNLVLAGTAQLLRQLADEAAQGKVDEGLIDVESTNSQIEEMKTKIAELEQAAQDKPVKIKVELDAEGIKEQVQAVVTAAQEQAAAAPPVIIKTVTQGGATSFSDGTGQGPPETMRDESEKRGVRL